MRYSHAQHCMSDWYIAPTRPRSTKWTAWLETTLFCVSHGQPRHHACGTVMHDTACLTGLHVVWGAHEIHRKVSFLATQSTLSTADEWEQYTKAKIWQHCSRGFTHQSMQAAQSVATHIARFISTALTWWHRHVTQYAVCYRQHNL
jgi:hypothetical protein